METRHSCRRVCFHVSFCCCMFWNFCDLPGDPYDPYVWAWQDRTCLISSFLCFNCAYLQINGWGYFEVQANQQTRKDTLSSDDMKLLFQLQVWRNYVVVMLWGIEFCAIQRTGHGARNGIFMNMLKHRFHKWQIHCTLICQRTVNWMKPARSADLQIFGVSGVESRITFRVGFGWGRSTSGTSDSTKCGVVGNYSINQ